MAHYLNLGQMLRIRSFVRCSAVLLLAVTMAHGILRSGKLDYEGSPMQQFPGKFASFVGMAADDIRITGLVHHDPDTILTALGVMPGSSLLRFDASQARVVLENMDWVAAASVQRKYPNKLEISVSERIPFAIWQRGSTYNVIDRAGAPMGMDVLDRSKLLLVTGEGANFAAEQLVNHLEANPLLMNKVSAAAMVGKRRWTLYLNNGVKIALPEDGIVEALAKIIELDSKDSILSKGISEIDLRIAGRMTVEIAEIDPAVGGRNGSMKLSQQ